MEEVSVAKKKNYWGLTIGILIVVLAIQVYGAYYFLYLRGYILSDALSRTANAFYVTNIHPQKLASIGLIWNPLPSFFQLPFLAFSNLWRPLATHGVSGGIVTAIFSAINAGYLFRLFKRYSLSTFLALVFVALFTFHPFIFYYGSNGMSEILFFTCIIVCVSCLCNWMEKRLLYDIMILAVMLAFGFLCRYEALALAAGIGTALIIVIFFMKDEFSAFKTKTLNQKFDYTIATGLVVFLPLLFSVLVWIMLNWAIMGDPLYFLSSTYSNTAQSEYILNPDVIHAMSSPINSLLFVFDKMLPFLLIFFVITVERIITLRLIKADYFILLVITASLAVFHYIMLITERSFGWLRFYSFTLPICIAWLPYEISKLKGVIKSVSVFAFILALLLSGAMIMTYYESQYYAPEEYEAFNQTDVSGVAKQNAVASRINEVYFDGVVLMDSFTTSGLILNLDYPENLIINTSESFQYAIKEPWKYGVRYFVITDPKAGVGNLDALNIEHPGLFEYGAEWCVEREHVGEFKIFEVLY